MRTQTKETGRATATWQRRVPCVNRNRNGYRQGCVGFAVPTPVKYRPAGGELTIVVALVCNRCGQAHGDVYYGPLPEGEQS